MTLRDRFLIYVVKHGLDPQEEIDLLLRFIEDRTDIDAGDLEDFLVKETDIENIEHEIIKKVSDENLSEFNKLIPILMKSLNIEK